MKTLNQKRLAKVIALGLVVGGFSFANVDNVYAANIGTGVWVDSAHNIAAPNVNVATQKGLENVNTEVAGIKGDVAQAKKDAAAAKEDAAAAKEDAKLAADKAQNAESIAKDASTVAKAANDQATINKSNIADLKQDMAGKADQSDVNDLTVKVNKNTGDIENLKKDKVETKDFEQYKKEQAAVDREQNKKLIQVNNDNIKQDTAIQQLQSQVGNATEKANHNYIKAEESLSENVSDLDGALKTEETERVKEDVRLDGRIDTVDQKFSGEVSRLDSRIDKVDDKINKVGAMAAAIANLHTMGYDPEAPTEFAMSMGQYRDETGMAIGLFHYPNRDFMLSLSVSRAGEEYMGGIGATWKFGRKSPEKMLAEQKEKAAKEKLAKAEAMKEAARQARVEAQMARHAKMLAEREAAK